MGGRERGSGIEPGTRPGRARLAGRFLRVSSGTGILARVDFFTRRPTGGKRRPATSLMSLPLDRGPRHGSQDVRVWAPTRIRSTGPWVVPAGPGKRIWDQWRTPPTRRGKKGRTRMRVCAAGTGKEERTKIKLAAFRRVCCSGAGFVCGFASQGPLSTLRGPGVGFGI